MLAASIAAFFPPESQAAVAMLTAQFDNTRAGANTNEVALTPANVNVTNFAKLFTYPVDGCVYAQPLVMTNVTIPGKGTHNILYIATEHDTVYAFDADTFVATPYWTNSFLNLPNTNTVSSGIGLPTRDLPFNNIQPEIGITGTPVIDPVSQTIYLEARTKEISGGKTNFIHRLHALDLATGLERSNSPVLIAATNYPGTGGPNGNGNEVDTDGAGHVLWSGLREQNRPGLTLVNGQVVFTYAEPGDILPYHGWMFSYDAHTLAQTSVVCLTPNGTEGGIWQGGGAPAADANGNLYVNTGNGDFNSSASNYANAYLRFSTTNGLQLTDYFAPSNQAHLQSSDLDLSSAGLLLLPDSAGSTNYRHLLLGGSKAGVIFLLNRDELGDYDLDNDNVVQELSGVVGGNGKLFGSPAYFNGLFYWIGSGDTLKSFAISNATMSASATAQSATAFTGGATPVVSAHGTSNAIVWAVNYSGTSNLLHAFNATNVALELYNTSLNAGRDALGAAALRFTMPSVVNGRVYVPLTKAVAVYGSTVVLPAPVISPNGGQFTNVQTVTLSNSYPGSAIYFTLDGTAPNISSPPYAGPFVLSHSAVVKAISALNGLSNSVSATATLAVYTDLLSGSSSNGVFVLPYAAPPNKTYVLQASTDLVNWVPISTNTPTNSPFNLTDPNAANFPRRFYRAIQLP